MALSAIQAAFRSSNARTIDDRRAEADERLAIRRANASGTDREFMGVVLFATGMSSESLQSLGDDLNLEIAAAEARIAAGQDGRVITIGVGERELALLSDFGLSERLRLVTGNRLYRIHQTMLADGNETSGRELLERFAELGPRFYNVTVVTDMETFARLRDLNTVAAVLVDETEESAARHRELVRQVAEQRGRVLR
jgi:hypothetical protein